MTEPLHLPAQTTMSTQAFLILCRLFDGCYDDLKKQENMKELVESIANALLSGVAYLQEQQAPPKEISVSLSFEQAFFLRKLLSEVKTSLPDGENQEKTRRWITECLLALDQVG